MNRLIKIVFLKEIKDMFRDKKTMITSLLIPLLLLPLISFIFGKAMGGSKEAVDKNLTLLLNDQGKSKFVEVIKQDSTITIENVDDGRDEVKDGKKLIYIEIPKDFDEKIAKNENSTLKIFYDNTSQKSNIAMGKVNSIIEAYSNSITSQVLVEKGLNPQILTPITIDKESFEKEDNAAGMFMLSFLVPMFILMYSVQGAIAPATDLGAGEKERGTLEPLLTTKAGRASILTGKLLAISTMGILCSVASLIGLVVSMKIPGSIFLMSGSEGTSLAIQPQAIAVIGVLSILMTIVSAGICLTISMFARSFKEAQTYMSPLIIITMLVAYGTFAIDAKNMPFAYFSVPLLNIVAVSKEVIAGIFNYTHIGVTAGWLFIYIVLSIILTKFMFNREEVIFRS